MAVDAILPTRQANGQDVIGQGDRLQVAHPMSCIESCASPNEIDALWRFLEASEFHRGYTLLCDEDGEPLGRYAEFSDKMDPQTYLKYEVAAFTWIRQFSLGAEWNSLAGVFIRMMTDRMEMSFVDFGSFLTNSDDEKISFGGAQVSMRMLGLRLRDSYRDYFRFYKTLQQEADQGREMSPREVLKEVDRNHMYSEWIKNFKRERGLSSG